MPEVSPRQRSWRPTAQGLQVSGSGSDACVTLRAASSPVSSPRTATQSKLTSDTGDHGSNIQFRQNRIAAL